MITILRDTGDILDRWSIAKLKIERNDSKESQREFKAFSDGFLEVKQTYPQYDWDQIGKLFHTINGIMWITESELRQGKIDNDKTAVRDAAVKTRELNTIRTGLRNLVNKLVGDGFQEIKKDHITQ